jgi:hypothetical protein
MCRQGASVIQTAVLDSVSDPDFRVYVAWVPILDTDTTAPDEETRALVHDERAAHFWDPSGVLPKLFNSTLSLPTGYPAWDAYMLYPPGPKWDDEPPTPVYWEHQLPGVAAAPPLDGQTFAHQLRRVLANQPGGEKGP